MNKSQIVIVAAIVGVVLLIVIYALVRFGGGADKHITYTPDFEKPIVKKDYKEEYKSRMDRIKQTRNIPKEKPVKEVEFMVYPSADTIPVTPLEKEEEIVQKETKPKESFTTAKKKKSNDAGQLETTYKRSSPTKTEPKAVTSTNQEPKQTARTDDFDFFNTVVQTGSSKNLSTQTNSQSVKGIKRYKAEIYGYHEIINNTAVQMRALEDIDYNGLNIHYNARLYGVASFKGGRFFIDINRVKTSQGEFSVNMKVYDNDGIEGLFYKSGIEKNLVDDKDNLVSDIARKSRRYEGEIIGDVVEELNEGVVNEKLKPLKKENYSIYVASN